MIRNWQRAYKVIKVYEGGNVDHPADPGGRTSRGVTQRVYDAYRVKNGKQKQDVYKASNAEVSEIYHDQYWKVAKCDELPSGVDLVVFDISVNSGPKRAYKILQAALRKRGNTNCPVDGVPGMVTVQAVVDDSDNDLLIAEMGRRRLAFYMALDGWKVFGKGWRARNDNCVKIAQAWANGSVGPRPVQIDDMAKALDTDITKSPVNPSTGTGVSVAGAAGSSGVEVLQGQLDSAQAALSPLSDYLVYAQYACTAIVVLGVIITAYGLYKNWKARRVEQADTDVLA